MDNFRSAVLSKKVRPQSQDDSRGSGWVFALLTIFSLLLLWLFLDTRHKSTHVRYETYLLASFDDAELPTDFTSDADHRYDGTSGYLYFDGVGQSLTSPTLTPHASYHVSFTVTLLNVAGTETYNDAIATLTLSAHDEGGMVLSSATFHEVLLGSTLEATFAEAYEVRSFTLTLTAYANLGGYQAYPGIDDFLIETPKESAL